ncbi:MAG: enoyl-CoA hydratase [Aeromicrobium erythreum]
MIREQHDGVLTIGFDRPDRLNAVNAGILADLADVVEQAAQDPQVRVIVLRGEGRAFCSGADLGDGASDAPPGTDTIVEGNRLVRALTGAPQPVVTVARGAVAGIGVPVALAGDLVVCDDTSFLLLAFTRIGLMPDGGASALVAAAIGRARTMRMALLAERMPAQDALDAGLVTHLFAAAELDERVDELVATLRSGPAAAYAATKRVVNAATLGSLEQAFTLEHDGQEALLQAADFREGAAAFREKRTPSYSDSPLD